jgi:hypothetical protein
MENAAPIEEKVPGLQQHGTSGPETTVPIQPQDISAALQGMRRERPDHEELGSIRPLRAAVARVDEVIE